MRRWVLLLTIAVGLSVNAFGQKTNGDTFVELKTRLQEQRGGWAGSKQPLAEAFNAERKRLGEDFEAELMKFIGSDVKRHYWVASFLTARSYLHGNQPLPEMALRVMQQGLSLLRKKEDRESRGNALSLSVNAAVLSAQMKLTEKAVAHKREVERLLTEDASLGAFFPAMYDEERVLYKGIGADAAQLGTVEVEEVEEAKIPKAKVNSGRLDNRAVSKPKPSYPQAAKSAKISGEVRVRVIYDETGKVIWARAIDGHKMLHEAAEQAAMQARFEPLVLSGTPVKVAGTLTYKF